MRYIFIINPTSGSGKTDQIIPEIRARMKGRAAYEIFVTTARGEAQQIAAGYHAQDHVVLVAVGGDGTVHEVLNGLQDGVPMAIFPLGSGNDYYRALGVRSEDPATLIGGLLAGTPVRVDYGICNGERFVNCANLGLDADINHAANQIGSKLSLLKPMGYMLAAVVHVLRPKPVYVQFVSDGQAGAMNVLLAAVMLGPTYGNGFRSAPDALLNDGQFDVCMVEPMRIGRILKLFPRYWKGTHRGIPEVRMFRSSQLDLKFSRPILLGMDGEIHTTDHATITMVAGGLTLWLAPDHSQDYLVS